MGGADWGDTIARFVLSHTHDRQLAQDIAQEIFWRLYQWHERHPRQVVHGGWLFTTARHLIIDARRKNRDSPNNLRVEEVKSSDPLMEQQVVQRLAVEDALRHLAPADQECLWLFYYQSLSVAEIAARVGLSETVRTRLHRARHRFAHVWKENHDDPVE
ncbi:hypothetical protein CO251_02815 [Sulfobacillus sp. hq2]|nr:hypothetical protein CO251_02815 [Sulfobacillus sp. hq2]